MSRSALDHASTTGSTHPRLDTGREVIRASEAPDLLAARASDPARTEPGTRRGTTGLLILGVVLVAAAAGLGARTWHVGAGLGTALFPVDGIVELAAVGTGTVAAGWVGGHALVALGWVLACRKGVRWAAGERAVSRHAPAVVRRLARAALGAGIGLALAAPTATALPERGAATDADGRPAVVVDLGWEPTGRSTGETGSGPAAPAPGARPAPERSALVNRGLRTGTGRAPVVVVEPGDTLWAIAADRLATERAAADRLATERAAAGPSDAEVAAAVERWHQVNRQVVGADPDLIRPGTVLHQP